MLPAILALTAHAATSVAYLGELALHPGVAVTVDRPVAHTRSGRGALVVAGDAGAYLHLRNHAGARLDAQVGFRHTAPSGWQVEAYAGAGYLHTWLAGPVYVVDDAGRAERITDLGRPAFMPIAGLGAGRELDPLTPFVRLETFGQAPFNHHLLPHFALLAGARF